MWLVTKNQGWAYSIGRLWSQVRAGSFFKLADSYFFQAEGSLLTPAEGSFFAYLMARLVARLKVFQYRRLRESSPPSRILSFWLG